jgi:hypothetical protein
VQPRKGAEDTYIFESTTRQLVIPTILYFCDLVTLMVDLDYRSNGLFHANPLDDISCSQIHGDWVTSTRHLVGESLNLGEGGRESIPMKPFNPAEHEARDARRPTIEQSIAFDLRHL